MANSKQKLVSYLRSQKQELQTKLDVLTEQLELGLETISDNVSKQMYIDIKSAEIEVEKLKLSVYEDKLNEINLEVSE